MEEINFQKTTINHLISAPAVAIVNANHMMSTEQVRLMIETCFTKKGGAYEPVMVNMSLKKSSLARDDNSEKGQKAEHHTMPISIPLLTMLPLNSLAVDETKIKFEMDIHAHQEVKQTGQTHAWHPNRSKTPAYQLAGAIKYSSHRDNETGGSHGTSGAPISIEMATSKLPLPLGVTSLIQAYARAIHPSNDNAGS